MNESLKWERGSRNIWWRAEHLLAPDPLLWAAEVGVDKQLAIVTLFNEETPRDRTNAFFYDAAVRSFQPLEIFEDGRCVRLLGCYAEGSYAVFNGANETEYVVDLDSHSVESSRYYR